MKEYVDEIYMLSYILIWGKKVIELIKVRYYKEF